MSTKTSAKKLAVARAFGQWGEEAVPMLSRHLAQRTVYDAGWTIYALQQTGRAEAIKPILEFARRQERGTALMQPGMIVNTLRRFPEESTRALIPLLGERCGHGAMFQLAHMGTEDAVEALIEHFNGEAFASSWGGDAQRVQAGWSEHCVWALWRLTGETLGMDRWSGERLLDEGRDAWKRWWAERPAGFRAKTQEWWRSPAAAPTLIAALDSPSKRFRVAGKDLLALEHPILIRDLEESDGVRPGRGVESARLWLKFDPHKAIPVIIEYGDFGGTPIGQTLRPVLAPLRETNEAAWQDSLQAKTPAAWQAWWRTHEGSVELKAVERWW